MKSLQRKSQVCTHFLVIVLVMLVWIQAATAQLSLSTPTDVQCYGRPVTLVCTHPVLPQEPEYLNADVSWRRDGTAISTGQTKLNSTTTTLQFTIAEDTVGNYTCFLVNAVRGGADESNSVPVIPLEPQPPSDINIIISLNTSIAFNWTHTPRECYKDRISYNVSWVNVDNNTESGFNVTGEHMYKITGLVANGNYTISVRVVVDRSIQSTAVSRDVTTGKPLVQPQNPTQSACRNRNFTLSCKVPPVYEDSYSNINWVLNSTSINSGFDLYSTANNGRELVIHNVTASTTGDYGCYIELNNGNLVAGETYLLQPLDSPKEPHNLIHTSGVTSINVSWEHDRSCFEDHELKFFVTWQTGDNSANMTVNGTTFNIPNLKPGTNYNICVTASTSDEQVRSEKKCLYIKTLELSMPGPSPLTDNLPYLALIIVGVVLVGVIVAGVYWWRKKRSRKVGCVKNESLWLLQVTDSLNRNGVKIISVQGNCVSAECDPCQCKREATTVDVYGTFNEKSFVMTFLKSGENNMEGFIVELLQQKSILFTDYCFALWAGSSVPRKVRSQFKKEPEWRKESCAVLPVQGLPWKVGSKEEKRFVQLFKGSTPPPNIEIKATHQVSFGLSRQEGEVTLTVGEIEQATVTIPHSVHPQVDVVKLVELLLNSKPPTTKEAHEDVPPKSAYASVNEASRDKYGSVGGRSTDGLLPKEDTSIVSGGRRRSYTRASFIDGVVSVLEILHVTILSVRGRCRRPECRDANSCTHLDTFQPDVVGVIRDASFVIKCVLHCHDGDVTGDHVATLNNVRTGLGLPLGLLVYDHMEGDPQLLSQQIPNGCSLVRVGVFTWDSDWVKCTLIALCKAFKTPLAVDTHPPVHQVQYTPISVDKNRPVPNPSMEKTNYSEISAIGEKAAQLVEDKPPPVPPKKETNPNEEQFQTDVIEVLAEIGMTLHLRELDLFTATYQSMGFLGVSRVESEEDVTPADVEKVVKAKTKMAASRAVLICNQDTVGSDRLIDLQEDSCYFIKAGGYGNKKWKNRLICNFKETVGGWMKEQNPGPRHSGEDGVLLKEDKGVLHPEKEEGVDRPEEESQLNQPVEETGITPMTQVPRLDSGVLSEEQSPLSNSEFSDTFGEEKYKSPTPVMGIERTEFGGNYSKSHRSNVNPGLESNQVVPIVV